MMRIAKGFTLLEVMVALVVVALSLGALMRAAGQFTGNQAYMRDRMFAEWVARNRMIEFQIARRWPNVGQEKGEVEFALREWRWVMQVTQTSEQNLRRMDIDVYAGNDEDTENSLATLSGFVENPQ